MFYFILFCFILLYYFEPLRTLHLVFHASCLFRFIGATLTGFVCHLHSVTNKDSYMCIDLQYTGDTHNSFNYRRDSPHARVRRQSRGDGKEAGHDVDWRGGDVNSFLTTNKTSWSATPVGCIPFCTWY